METAWLKEFHEKNQRKVRVLHIGNIANNAYYISKFLNDLGFHSDVFGYENYHIMASPEWEEAEFTRLPKDQFFPDWWNLDIGNYERPRWFVQGPWETCIQYLQARLENNSGLENRLWEDLAAARKRAFDLRVVFQVARVVREILPEPYSTIGKNFLYKILNFSGHKHRDKNQSRSSDPDLSDNQLIKYLIEEYSRHLENGQTPLSFSDIELYLTKSKSLSNLMSSYDVVQVYGTDAIYALLSGFRPYVAFEHGTLRDSPEVSWAYKGPFYPNASGKLTALAYKLADHVLITNADAIESVRRLGIKNFSPIGHPFDENGWPNDADYTREIRSKFTAKYLLLCPIRHDWIDKGVDKHIRMLPALRQAIGEDFKVLFMPWGKEIDRSKELIRKLNCQDNVDWVGPFGRVWFRRWLTAVDVVLDQMTYESFGGITPQALACGVPVIVQYSDQKSSWMFGESPPLLKAETEDDIVRQVKIALKPNFKQNFGPIARNWVKKNHSSTTTIEELLRIYSKLIS